MMADIYLTNSLTRKKEKFLPIKPPKVGMYTCGMTVYDYAHIGHGRKYVCDDVLRRVLTLNGYKVTHVQNVTDVGHLVSDADEGEDKLEKGAKKLGKTVWEVSEFFTKHFYETMDKLNVLRPTVTAKATDHIKEQVALVKKLVDKGYAYDTPEAVYFDVSKFSDYAKLFGQKIGEKRVGARPEVKKGKHKKHPADFSLWFKRVGRFAKHTMHWDSPWGDGFPGWHLECSAMALKYLGGCFDPFGKLRVNGGQCRSIDIHTGGEDHLSIHHPNEIAQSEAATGKVPFVKYWIHHAFLKVEGKKMSKSLGNLYTVEDVEKKGFGPLALRYLYLTAHYKDPLNFTWEGLSAAQNALSRLRTAVISGPGRKQRTALSEEKMRKIEKFREKFLEAVNGDLNTPQGLAVLWQVLKSNIPARDKYDLAVYFDEVFGLGLAQISKTKLQIPNGIRKLVDRREKLRKEGKFEQADKVRKQIAEIGYLIEDTKKGPKLKPKKG